MTQEAAISKESIAIQTHSKSDFLEMAVLDGIRFTGDPK